jgi:hypothetical protein
MKNMVFMRNPARMCRVLHPSHALLDVLVCAPQERKVGGSAVHAEPMVIH